MRKRKFNCGYWDKVFEDRMDLLSPEGVEEWGKELMSLEELAIHYMSPVCSSFHRFVNAKNTKRSQVRPMGDESYRPTWEGNRFGECTAFALCLGYHRKLVSFCETPDGSFLYQLDPVTSTLEFLESQGQAHHQLTYLCAFCNKRRCPNKPLRLFATRPFVYRMQRKCDCAPGRHMSLMKTNSRGGVCPTKVRSSRKVRSNVQRTRMKESQIYPTQFA